MAYHEWNVQQYAALMPASALHRPDDGCQGQGDSNPAANIDPSLSRPPSNHTNNYTPHSHHHFSTNYHGQPLQRQASASSASSSSFDGHLTASGRAVASSNSTYQLHSPRPTAQVLPARYSAPLPTIPPHLLPPATPFPSGEAPPPADPSECYELRKPTATHRMSSEALYREFILVEGRISTLVHRNKVLEAQVQWLYQRLEASQGYFDAHRSELQTLKSSVENEVKRLAAQGSYKEQLEGGDVGEDGDDDDESDQSDEEEAGTRKKKSARIAGPVSSLITQTFLRFLDIPKLDATLLPTIDQDNPDFFSNLPFLRGSKDVQQQRFYWDRTSKDPHNHRALQTMAEHARKYAASSGIADAEAALDRVPAPKLIRHFCERYDRIKKKVKGTDGSAARSKKPTTNRAPGKLQVRKRKRGQLPEGHTYLNPRYDAAMHHQLMSDDEDCFNEDGQRNRNQYISHQPTWRSQELADFFKTIDAIPDPQPSNSYVSRIPGSPREVELHHF
ncbi:hypothetical protein EST38_g6242 [Candolleomyces aberdarensis]|uniref:Uncharacterized protein n=1 Tax=Candolleomyces aberdarensis TaxID=2316362 RepID=A0A4Q2DIA5_9AGAR|nr:hypothetical protein EST38_g6242 [Candolleomyces aberdarensis]